MLLISKRSEGAYLIKPKYLPCQRVSTKRNWFDFLGRERGGYGRPCYSLRIGLFIMIPFRLSHCPLLYIVGIMRQPILKQGLLFHKTIRRLPLKQLKAHYLPIVPITPNKRTTKNEVNYYEDDAMLFSFDLRL